MTDAALSFDQLLYGWSQSNAFGRRGFGIIAMSEGWRALLGGSDDALGPLVAFPEPGPQGAPAPAHGGFTFVRGRPVLFRRLPTGTDSLNRPGNYCVQMLLPIGPDLTPAGAAALLAGDWLTSGLPDPSQGALPPLDLPAPGPRRGSAAASPVACGALLQALSQDRPAVLCAESEAVGRAALCDAIRRLPPGLGEQLTFSTLEAEPGRFGFQLSVAVAGWAKAAGDRKLIRADLAGGGAGLTPACARWGAALAGATASSLRGLPEPVTAESLGLRLDAQAKLADNPASLSGAELISVLASPEGQAWAAGPIAPGVVREVVAGLDPELGAQLARTAQRRPAVSALLREVGWDLVARPAGAGRGAQSLLVGLGEPSSRIELASLTALDTLTRRDAERYLRLSDEPGATFDAAAAAAKISWDAALMKAHPGLWFEALLSARDYRGPRATREVVAGLQTERVGAAVAAAHRDCPSDDVVGARIWRGMPSTDRDRTAFLRVIAASGDAGLGVVLEHILDQKAIDAAVRAPLLREFWPIMVRELRLPGYLADSLEPVGDRRRRFAALAVLAATAIAAFAAGWLLV